MARSLMLFALLAVLVLPGTARAQVAGTIDASAGGGYARLVMTFDKPVRHEQSVANGVLVVTFSEPVAIELQRVPTDLPRYIVAARLDPNGTAIRLALNRALTVNTIAARNRLFIDLLPSSWMGPPPGLPQDVVEELIREAEREAERLNRSVAEAAADRPLLDVRVGRYPTFSRIVFDWREPTETDLSRRGDRVTIAFDTETDVDLTRLNVDAPPGLVQAEAAKEDGRLIVGLDVQPDTDVRGFREGATYVVDLAAPGAGDGSDGAVLPQSLRGEPPALPRVPLVSEQIVVSANDPAAPEDGSESPAKADTPPDVEEDAPTGRPSDDDGDDLVSISVSTLDLTADPAGDAQPSPEPQDAPDTGDTRPADDSVEADPQPAAAEPVSDPTAPGATPDEAASTMPVVVETRTLGTTLQIMFPFPKPVAAAAFQRAETLWVVFDNTDEFDITSLQEVESDVVTSADLIRSSAMQVLRLRLSGRYLATATAKAHHWVVSLGDLVLEPTAPVSLKRALRTDSRLKVEVELANSGRVHWIEDDEVGDRLAVVTAYGPPRGLIKRQSFVDFQALPTAHGLAIRPNADDLAVRINQGSVVITRDQGLTLSSSLWPQYVPGRRATTDGTRPGFIDFDTWGQGGRAALRHHTQRLLTTVASLPVNERVDARLELVRLLLANELGAEALGVMRLTEAEDAKVTNDPLFRAMRGVAYLMHGRIEEAREDLSVHSLSQDPHAALWRGLVELGALDWRAAQLSFADGEDALDAYPPAQRARFQLGMARAALQTTDLETATRNLDALTSIELGPTQSAEVALLKASLAEALGDTSEAMRGYDEVADSRVRPVAAEATLRRTLLYLREGRMTADAAIEALEGLSMTWRDDNIELDALRRLSQLYADAGRYRDALTTMKVAITSHAEGTKTRIINADMNDLFVELFLDGKADTMAPSRALGLYYDFRELTPVGRRGDELIRKLADRLVSVDLLDQAAELLDHQVHNRLTGAARAQVAADLSLVYLMARRPEDALRAIHRTRQAVLPETLKRKRSILEARALSELGRVELAVELLQSMEGDDVERLKADAFWTGQRWQSSGEQIERLLGARWQDGEPLTDDERIDVIRTAISYALADDRLGLDRLRRKFTSKMAASPDAKAFDLVTDTSERDGVAFRNLAKEIAEIDTLNAFLDEYRAREDPFNTAADASDAES